MKTKNNNQKTASSSFRMILNGSVLIATLVLLSWSVNAQEYWNQFLSSNNSAEMTQTIAEFEKAETLASAISTEIEIRFSNSANHFAVETESEKNLNIETWMTNETLFVGNFEVIEESDKALNLESWMVQSNHAENYSNIQSETDRKLEVEEWMTNEASFNSANLLSEKDAELDLESWMLDDSIFISRLTAEGEVLKLEAWMADNNFWGF